MVCFLSLCVNCIYRVRSVEEKCFLSLLIPYDNPNICPISLLNRLTILFEYIHMVYNDLLHFGNNKECEFISLNENIFLCKPPNYSTLGYLLNMCVLIMKKTGEISFKNECLLQKYM